MYNFFNVRKIYTTTHTNCNCRFIAPIKHTFLSQGKQSKKKIKNKYYFQVNKKKNMEKG